MNILEQLAAHARQRVAAASARVSPEEMHERALEGGPADGAAFTAALRRPGLRLICEIKRASPSKGLIAPDFPYLDIARTYEAAGADAISCLTEPKWFLGSDEIFREIRAAVAVPMLRKDFTVSAYQIDEAKRMGANAVLLIAAMLTPAELEHFLAYAGNLGLAALVEAHDEREIDAAVSAGASVIGVNNRNLKDFTVDFSNAARLRDRIPAGCVYVAESGVRTAADAARLREIGADAALIGEALMRAPDRAAMIAALRGGA